MLFAVLGAISLSNAGPLIILPFNKFGCSVSHLPDTIVGSLGYINEPNRKIPYIYGANILIGMGSVVSRDMTNK